MTQLTPDAGVALTRPSDRQKYLWAGGTVFDVVLDGSDTGGAIALLHQLGHQGDATPRHIHRHEAEIFYVVQGLITAWAGDDPHQLEEGSAVHLPAGLPHALRVDSDVARIITITTSPRFAEFVRAAGVATDDVPATWDFDLARLMAAAPEYGIDIVGPPPG